MLLQGKSGAKHNITKNADLRKTFEAAKDADKIHNNPILSAVIKNHLQSYDPRSPTQDFERTPIIIASKLDDLNKEKKAHRLQNGGDCGSPCLKNDDNENYDSCVEAQESPDIILPKNLANGFLDLTLNDTIKDSDEPLGSSTASNEAIESNISDTTCKPTQLLETNFDYMQPNNHKTDVNKENSNSIDNHTQDDIKNIPVFKILDDDPRSPTTGIERTPIVVAKTNNTELCEDNVENMSDDTLIKVLQNTNIELRQNAVKPLHNPDGLMIYEDDTNNLNDTPKKSKSAGSSGSRTPLSCMKNKADTGHTRSKSANTLHDSKEKKVNRRVSHIPRLKSLTKNTKLNPVSSSVSLKTISKCSAALGGDCENTPPHSHRDRWDKDNSIVL